MDSIIKKRTALKADTPDFQYNYVQENMSMNDFDTVAQKDITKEQLRTFRDEEKMELLQKASAEYEAYFKEKTEEIENNAQLSQWKKNKALKELNKSREAVRGAKMDEVLNQKELLECREELRGDRGNKTLTFIQQEVNARVSQEGDALAELSKEESTEIQQDADLLGVIQLPGRFGDAPGQQEPRMQANRNLLKGSKSADQGEGDAFADQLVALVKELNPVFPHNDLQNPVAVQRWKVADHAANLLDKRPEVRARLRQRDPDGLDRIYFMRTRYQMGVDYLDHRTSQASIQFSREFLDKKAKSGEFVSKRLQLLAKEKAFGFTLKSGTFADYQKAKAEKLAAISKFSPQVLSCEQMITKNKGKVTVEWLGEGCQANFQQALKLAFGNQDLGNTQQKMIVNAEKAKMKAAVVQFNETYREHKNPEEIAGEPYVISEEAEMVYKLQISRYEVEGDPAGASLGEPLFRSFRSFGDLPIANDHDPEELAEMLRDLGAGYAVGEEKTEEKTAAFRERNIRGLAKYNAISNAHYAKVKDKWMGVEHWPTEKFVANFKEFVRDMACVQHDEHVYSKLGHCLPDNESEAFKERKLLQLYFTQVSGFCTLKGFIERPGREQMVEEEMASLRALIMNNPAVKIMNERNGGGGAL